MPGWETILSNKGGIAGGRQCQLGWRTELSMEGGWEKRGVSRQIGGK